jgi:hypothetical protein
LGQLRQDYPEWPFIITEDGLSANAPLVQEFKKHNLRYILGVKEGDHAFLFETVGMSSSTKKWPNLTTPIR